MSVIGLDLFVADCRGFVTLYEITHHQLLQKYVTQKIGMLRIGERIVTVSGVEDGVTVIGEEGRIAQVSIISRD